MRTPLLVMLQVIANDVVRLLVLPRDTWNAILLDNPDGAKMVLNNLRERFQSKVKLQVRARLAFTDQNRAQSTASTGLAALPWYPPSPPLAFPAANSSTITCNARLTPLTCNACAHPPSPAAALALAAASSEADAQEHQEQPGEWVSFMWQGFCTWGVVCFVFFLERGG